MSGGNIKPKGKDSYQNSAACTSIAIHHSEIFKPQLNIDPEKLLQLTLRELQWWIG